MTLDKARRLKKDARNKEREDTDMIRKARKEAVNKAIQIMGTTIEVAEAKRNSDKRDAENCTYTRLAKRTRMGVGE